ncbi:MAG: aminotransferase class I/II-fold pyridoxal phosphate-dependent enzyme, partial [Clostridium paraputrificum]
LDRSDRVIYIKSFSKIFLPGIRIGYIVTPNIFRESMQNSKFNTDIATSSLMQRALELYIKDGAWKDNISYLNVEYKKRYELMSKLIDEELGDMVTCNKPGGGLTFYLKIADEEITSRELFLRLSKKNVYITPGVLFFRNMRDGDRNFRIGFSQTDEGKIKKGLKLIREELETWHI